MKIREEDKRSQWRIVLAIGTIWLLVVLCLWRLAVVQVVEQERFSKAAQNQQIRKSKFPPIRGKIFDRNMREFATTNLTYDMYLSPRDCKNSKVGRTWSERDLRAGGYDDDEIRAIRKARTQIPSELPIEAVWPLAEDIAEFTRKTPQEIYGLLRGEGRVTTRTKTLYVNTQKSIPAAYAEIFGLSHFFPNNRFSTPVREKVQVAEPADVVVMRGITQEMRDRFLSVFKANREGEPSRGIRPRYTFTTSSLSVISENVVYFSGANNRNYPQHELGGTVVGLTIANEWGDNQGAFGVEMAYDADLRGNPQGIETRVSGTQKTLDAVTTDIMKMGYGSNIVMTIDDRIQRETERALQSQVTKLNADGGQAIVMDVKTGEILAMASSPSFNPERRLGVEKNRSITDAIEPGSVMKIFTYTAAMDAGKITPQTPIGIGGKTWTMPNGRTITDSHYFRGDGNVLNAFMQSSNIGAVKVFSMVAGSGGTGGSLYKTPYDALKKFGFGDATGIDLPYEHKGLFRAPNRWSGLSQASLAQGYEILVTPVQVVAAVAAIGNDGMYMQPHVMKAVTDYDGHTIRSNEPKAVRRVCSVQTARTMRSMMEQVVVEGTAMSAGLENWSVGGKTGTTKKHRAGGGYYSDRFMGSFCGLAPIVEPRVAIYVWIDNPTTADEQYYGGTSAAPMFRDIAQACMEILKVPHTDVPLPKSKDKLYKLEMIRKKTASAVKRFLTPQAVRVAKDSSLSSGTLTTVLTVLGIEDRVAPDTMPDLRTKTLREAADALKGLDLPFVIEGAGYVVAQNPAPHMPFDKTTSQTVRLMLGTRTAAEAMLLDDKLPVYDNPQGAVVTSDSAPDTGVAQEHKDGLQLRYGNETIPLVTTRTLTPTHTQLSTNDGATTENSNVQSAYPDRDSRVNGAGPVTDFSQSWYSHDRKKAEEEARRNRATTVVPTLSPTPAPVVAPLSVAGASEAVALPTQVPAPDAAPPADPTGTFYDYQVTQTPRPTVRNGGSSSGSSGNLLRDRVPQRTPDSGAAPRPNAQRSGTFYDYQ